MLIHDALLHGMAYKHVCVTELHDKAIGDVEKNEFYSTWDGFHLVVMIVKHQYIT